MTEQKKIVTEHFPVDRLPEELRRGIESGRMVRVVVEAEVGVAPKRSLRQFLGSGRGAYPTAADAVDEIRKLRDESDR
jgi:hypothetical protein